jgi:hypothetical protein
MFLQNVERLISSDELLGIKPQPHEVSKFEPLHSDPESRQMASLPQKDQRAVIRLINSLVASSGNGHTSASAHQ